MEYLIPGLLLSSRLLCAYMPTSVLELDDRVLDITAKGNWLVMLYAPWCVHCKRFLPTFDQVALSLVNSDVQVAKLDCTKFPNVANKLKVSAYPSFRIFRQGDVFEYLGERSKEAMVEFTHRVVGPTVREIKDKNDFKSIRDRHSKGVFFLLVCDDGGPSSLQEMYYSLAERMFTNAFFYKIHPSHLTPEVVDSAPSILCFKDQKYVSFLQRTQKELDTWFQSERWPEMPLIKQETIHDIGSCCNKFLVVFVLDLVERRKLNSRVKKVNDLAKSFLQRYADLSHGRFQFVWFDGNSLANSFLLRTVPIPSFFVLNYTSYEHYLPEDDVFSMTEDALWVFLQKVDSGEVKARGGRGVVQRIKQFCFEIFSSVMLMFTNQPLLACCLFGLPLGIASVICYTICSTDVSLSIEEVYNESDETDSDHEKAD